MNNDLVFIVGFILGVIITCILFNVPNYIINKSDIEIANELCLNNNDVSEYRINFISKSEVVCGNTALFVLNNK